MEHKLIETLEDMMNGDATSDILTFNDFVEDFIQYMDDMYGMDASTVRKECGLLYWKGRG